MEEILKKRTRGGVLEYLVRWVGYLKEYDQWIKEENVDALNLVNAFNIRESRRRKVG